MTIPDQMLADAEARRRALSDLDQTMLVEAGAGTGKTSLLAARTTRLLLGGTPPAEIAAITFTEAAASELAERVHAFVTELLIDKVPEPLVDVLPNGLDPDMRAHLERAAEMLDGLTTTTIHGFCQIILADHAIEADVDPGAQIMDEDHAVALFERVFDAWLGRRLSEPSHADDPILVLTREDPRAVVKLLREIAAKRRRHRSAQAFTPDLTRRWDIELAHAIDELKRWCISAPPEPFALQVADELEALGLHFVDAFSVDPSFVQLWRLAHPPQSRRMKKDSSELVQLATGNLWKGAGDDNGAALRGAFAKLYEEVDVAYRELLAAIGAVIASRVSRELDEVLKDYAVAKRAAAVLDFDDLLERAVDLLRDSPAVRDALADRFRYLLVDEFQDTDPVQCDIIFRIAGSAHADHWEEVPQRPGALFLVGDPKQSLYSFRGAAIRSYDTAKAVIENAFPGNVLQVTSNFRAVEDILVYVNRCFREPLSAAGQPGYVALDAVRRIKCHTLPCAAKVTVSLPPNPRMAEIREAEAEIVADLCARLIGGLELRGTDGSPRTIQAGDIGLLAPAGTDLWRYERALQERKLPFASKAGSGFYRRQEVQDLVVLTRLLADPADTLALGAFLRGPLVGMTDEALLDVTADLAAEEGEPRPRLSLRTPLDQIENPELKHVLAILQDLRRRARSTSPSHLLHEAVERLAIRVILARREPRRASAANANVDLFLERAAAYDVRGLRRFAQDISLGWSQGEPAQEGRVDSDGEAIDIVSIHSAKGLEWPVVIAINMASLPRRPDRIVHRSEDNTLHWTVGGVAAPHLAQAMSKQDEDLACERARLLYVGCTRAKDLLILPDVPGTAAAYVRAVDLAFDTLPELELNGITGVAPRPDRGPDNLQDRITFDAEAARIAEASRSAIWLRPSDHDADKWDIEDDNDDEVLTPLIGDGIVGAGRVRGLLLHKLLEEILSGDLVEEQSAMEARARYLLPELVSPDTTGLPDCAEIAITALKTLELPEVAAMRRSLIPEVPIYATIGTPEGHMPMAGRADALSIEDGKIMLAIDWKSDVAPTEGEQRAHAEQLRSYLVATEAPRGALIYASLGLVRWVDSPRAHQGGA